MKRLNQIKILSISILLSFVFIFSCKGPDADARKIIRKTKKINKITRKAISNNVLDEKEIKDINNIYTEIKDITSSYSQDSINEDINSYIEKLNPKSGEIFEEFYNLILNLYNCEGAENIKF